MRIGGNFLVIENLDTLRRAQVRRQAIFARKPPGSFIAKDYRTELSSPAIQAQSPSDAPLTRRLNPNFNWDDFSEEQKSRSESQTLNTALNLVRNFPSAYAGAGRRISSFNVSATHSVNISPGLNEIASAVGNRDFDATAETANLVATIKRPQPSLFQSANQFLSGDGLESLVI